MERHQHTRQTESRDQATDERGLMLCNDCGEPLFYCWESSWYFHIDPLARPCFLSDSSHAYPQLGGSG